MEGPSKIAGNTHALFTRAQGLFEFPHSGLLMMVLIAVVLISAGMAVAFNQLLLLGIPVLLIGAFFAIVDYKNLYFLLWASIPVSTEVFLPNGLGTDLPDEPLMIILFGLATVLFISRLGKLSLKILLHPITILLMLHLGWIALTTLSAGDVVISIKFLLAKSWYVGVFYFLTYFLVKDKKDFRRWFKWVGVPLLLTILVIIVRHVMEGMTFESVYKVLNPFYRNHVSYAAIIGVFVPFAWFFRDRLPGKFTGYVIFGLLLVALYFAYTRAAYLGLLAAGAGYVLIRLRLIKLAIIASFIAALIGLNFLVNDNRYIDYAPNYDRTITHYEFGSLIEATYNLEDISSMERFYRWIAGAYMVRENPLVGFGPGNFYHAYRPYTDENFVTFVSANPERSGIHNYFLMTAVEQGIPGLLIFITLLCVALIKAEWLYHQPLSSEARNILSASTCSLMFIIFILLLNDVIETDKIGSFFFFILAIIVSLDLRRSWRAE